MEYVKVYLSSMEYEESMLSEGAQVFSQSNSLQNQRYHEQPVISTGNTNTLHFSAPTASQLLPKVWNEAKVQRTNTLLAIEHEMYWICKIQLTQSALEDTEHVFDYL